jgi:hypothetical protein
MNTPGPPKQSPPNDNFRIYREYTAKRPNSYSEHHRVNKEQNDN